MIRPRRLLLGSLACSTLLLATLVHGPSNAAAAEVTARDLLTMLEVREEFAPTRYTRSAFRHWVDADRDCQDTRVEVLVRDDQSGSRHGCRVTSGRWVSWLDGRRTTTSRDFDVDHLVALAEAWYSGAYAWSAAEREAFANDLGYEWSLRAVSASSNRSKSDRDPAEWLPIGPVQCDYVSRWMAVKYRWGLAIDSRERSAIDGVLTGTCGSRSLTLPVRVAPSRSGGSPATPATLPSPPAASPPASSAGTTPPTGPMVSNPVSPGAFCSPSGAMGRSTKGVVYTCRSSDTDTRNRWRR